MTMSDNPVLYRLITGLLNERMEWRGATVPAGEDEQRAFVAYPASLCPFAPCVALP